MDINEAAIQLKKIEIVESEIKALQEERAISSSVEYGEFCTCKIQDLIKLLDAVVDPRKINK